MRPQDYPLDLEQLQCVWARVLAPTAEAAAAQADAPGDPLVFAAWERCRQHADPTADPAPERLAGEAFAALLQNQEFWTIAALPYAEDIYQYNAGLGCAVLLTDRVGRLLTLIGDPAFVDRLENWGLGPGACWSEEQSGCNAVGLALNTAMPAQVVGAEHFFRCFHELAATAAPIHAPDGAVLGVIGLATAAVDASPRDLALLMAAARAVSNQLQADALLSESNEQLDQLRAIIETAGDGVLMWNGDGRIHHVNRTAARMIGLTAAHILGRPINELVRWSADVRAALHNDRPIANLETVLIVNQRRVPCLLTVQPVHREWGSSGSVAFLRPIEHVRRLVSQQIGLTADFDLSHIKSNTPAMRSVLDKARQAARNSLPILLEGESGVGKTLLAQAIHNAGPRAGRPFVTVNCRAIPRPLLQTELFGQAGSDGRPGRPSKFELANGGTLMVNQAHSAPPELQMALVELIDRRRLLRPGGDQPIAVNVRLILSTPPDVEQLLADRSLRPELYYRLHANRITLPALRERCDDIPLLAEHILATLRADRLPTVEPEALAALCAYGWPGNVRELEIVLEQAAEQAGDRPIGLSCLPVSVRRGALFGRERPLKPVQTVREAEYSAIVRAGRLCNGVLTQMARELGMSRTTLWRRMKAHNLTAEQFRAP